MPGKTTRLDSVHQMTLSGLRESRGCLGLFLGLLLPLLILYIPLGSPQTYLDRLKTDILLVIAPHYLPVPISCPNNFLLLLRNWGTEVTYRPGAFAAAMEEQNWGPQSRGPCTECENQIPGEGFTGPGILLLVGNITPPG